MQREGGSANLFVPLPVPLPVLKKGLSTWCQAFFLLQGACSGKNKMPPFIFHNAIPAFCMQKPFGASFFMPRFGMGEQAQAGHAVTLQIFCSKARGTGIG